jgi:hypothetical protein
MKCKRCEKDLEKAKPFYGRRYGYGKNKEGETEYGLYCIECEPYPKPLEQRH